MTAAHSPDMMHSYSDPSTIGGGDFLAFLIICAVGLAAWALVLHRRGRKTSR